MWKLTIYQKKQYETWESEQEVSYVSEDAGELLDLADYLAKHKPSKGTRYELKEVEQ